MPKWLFCFSVTNCLARAWNEVLLGKFVTIAMALTSLKLKT
jgi:hypothetical protein